MFLLIYVLQHSLTWAQTSRIEEYVSRVNLAIVIGAPILILPPIELIQWR